MPSATVTCFAKHTCARPNHFLKLRLTPFFGTWFEQQLSYRMRGLPPVPTCSNFPDLGSMQFYFYLYFLIETVQNVFKQPSTCCPCRFFFVTSCDLCHMQISPKATASRSALTVCSTLANKYGTSHTTYPPPFHALSHPFAPFLNTRTLRNFRATQLQSWAG